MGDEINDLSATVEARLPEVFAVAADTAFHIRREAAGALGLTLLA